MELHTLKGIGEIGVYEGFLKSHYGADGEELRYKFSIT